MVLKEEKKIEHIINRKINLVINRLQNKKNLIEHSLNNFNPLTSHIYFKLSFYYLIDVIRKYFYFIILDNYKKIKTTDNGKQNK